MNSAAQPKLSFNSGFTAQRGAHYFADLIGSKSTNVVTVQRGQKRIVNGSEDLSSLGVKRNWQK